MKRLIASPFVFLVACGSSSNMPVEAGVDAAVDVAVDAPIDGNTPYEQAVLAAEWVKLAGPSVSGGEKQDDIFFLDAMTGYVASGPEFAIWETTNGGTSFTSVFNKTGTYFRSLAFLDAQHGFAGNLGAGLIPQVTDTNVLYATSNGGSTWNAVTSITGPAASGICNLTVIDATHLVAVGRTNGPANMLVSSDAGNTWTSMDLSAQFSMLIDARFTSPTDGILGRHEPELGVQRLSYERRRPNLEPGVRVDDAEQLVLEDLLPVGPRRVSRHSGRHAGPADVCQDDGRRKHVDRDAAAHPGERENGVSGRRDWFHHRERRMGFAR